MNRNRLLFVRRNASAAHAFLFFIYFSTVVHARFIANCFKDGQLKQVPLFAKALVWNIKSSLAAKIRKESQNEEARAKFSPISRS